MAAAIAFYSLFSFFPLVLAFISVAGFVVNSPEEQTELARDIASVIPVETEFIARTVEGVVSARATHPQQRRQLHQVWNASMHNGLGPYVRIHFINR